MAEEWFLWNQVPDIAKSLDQITDPKKKAEVLQKLKDSYVKERQDKFELMLARLKELNGLDFVKLKRELMDKIKECIANYLDSRFLSTIALCGIIAEDMVLDIIQITKISINGNELSNENKRDAFQNLSQEYKIKTLQSMQIIPPDIGGKLQQIRTKRNDHIHPRGSVSEQKDALIMINLLMEITQKQYGVETIPFEVFAKLIGGKK